MQFVDTDTIENLTSALSQRFITDQLRLTTAGPYTGGELTSALCVAEDVPEFCGIGFATFTNQAEMKIPSISRQSLEWYSAMNEKVAAEVTTSAIEYANADTSIVIVGYGGPEGGKDSTPVDTIWSVWHTKGQNRTVAMYFAGDCETVLVLTVRFVLAQLLQLLL